MDGRDKITQRRETFFEALIFGEIGEIRVPDIEIEAQTGQSSLVDKIAEVTRIAHFAGGVLNTACDAYVVRVQDEVFERTERGVALAGVGGFAAAARATHGACVGQVLGPVDDV